MFYIIITLGVFAGVVSGIIGTGASIMLLPVLTYVFGTKAAIPIMTIAAIMGNISRVIVWWREVNVNAFLLYAIPGVPAAVLGANTLWVIPLALSNLCIGSFFVLFVLLRRWKRTQPIKLSRMQLSIYGAAVGYLTGIVFSTGPLTIPIFAGYGLIKGALLSTEAAASFAIYLAKVSTFEAIGALPWSVFCDGLLVGSTLIVGISLGKRCVLKISEKNFNYVIDAMMLLAGISMWFRTVIVT
ncbi:sulfite exporter TauE/SafE family protein [Yersinia intermedia]|uniref:sulfite exporter TauE/SafE family protein n=1 Tax=Yersinia intermedia TaxID=631 RepID=UPI0005E782E0|nr:sulfite exporter TauE/SafE family protein [Yersinia intermedia]CND47696.1 Sulfite exporter TauE/SafE [Yersinia intermedia]